VEADEDIDVGNEDGTNELVGIFFFRNPHDVFIAIRTHSPAGTDCTLPCYCRCSDIYLAICELRQLGIEQ
jgi:hypothetical protein